MSCPGPRQSLITGEYLCRANVHDCWPDEGQSWEAFCAACRGAKERSEELSADADREEAA